MILTDKELFLIKRALATRKIQLQLRNQDYHGYETLFNKILDEQVKRKNQIDKI